MFLLFTGVEACDVSLAHAPAIRALEQGLRRSIQLISADAVPFLMRLLLPGLVLYVTGVAALGVKQGYLVDNPTLRLGISLPLLLVWWLFFVLAQLSLQFRAVQMEDGVFGATLGEASGCLSLPDPAAKRAMEPLQRLIGRFEHWCNWSAALVGVAITFWVVWQLGRNGLLTLSAFIEAFQQVVMQVTTIVQAFLDLLLKLGFLALVVATILVVVVVVIGLGRGRVGERLRQLANGMRRGFGGFGEFLHNDLNLNFNSATVGLGTLITALSTVAVQTYASVQKIKLQEQQQDKIQQESRRATEEERKQRNLKLDGLEKKLNDQLRAYIIKDKKSSADRQAFSTNLRAILHEIGDETKDGEDNGQRKGQLLRILYEAGGLTAKCDNIHRPSKTERNKWRDLRSRGRQAGDSSGYKELKQLVTRNLTSFSELESMTQQQAEEKIQERCLPPVFLDSMDFSGADLGGAYLKGAFLPFINLSRANLRGAILEDSDLRFANLGEADLTAANLKNADLGKANMVGSDFTGVDLCQDPTDITGAVGFYTHVPIRGQCPVDSWGIVSWANAKEFEAQKARSGKSSKSPGGNTLWTFCPLDPENSPSGSMNRPETGAKCMNRQFMGGQDSAKSQALSQALSFAKRNWSGGLFTKTTFKNLTLDSVAFIGANLEKSRFENVRLRNVNFSGANLSGVVMQDSSLDAVNFTGADLQGMQLKNVRARNTTLRGALYDKSLILGTFNTRTLRQIGYDSDTFAARIQNEPATFRQDVLAPVLFAPLQLRPQHLLFWMLMAPLPTAIDQEQTSL